MPSHPMHPDEGIRTSRLRHDGRAIGILRKLAIAVGGFVTLLFAAVTIGDLLTLAKVAHFGSGAVGILALIVNAGITGVGLTLLLLGVRAGPRAPNASGWAAGRKGARREKLRMVLEKAQSLSASEDLESLTFALDLTDGIRVLGQQKPYQEIGIAAASIHRDVLPRVQAMGAVRCEELADDVDRLIDQKEWGAALRGSEQALLDVQKYRLSEAPISETNRQLAERISRLKTDDRLVRGLARVTRESTREAREVARQNARESLQRAKEQLDSGKPEQAKSTIEYALHQVERIPDPQFRKSARALLQDKRISAWERERARASSIDYGMREYQAQREAEEARERKALERWEEATYRQKTGRGRH